MMEIMRNVMEMLKDSILDDYLDFCGLLYCYLDMDKLSATIPGTAENNLKT